jgi:hypothetical protein
MALSKSDLSDLLDALRVGEGVDLIREIARWVLQELIEAEAAEKIGAGRYERVDGRVTERNGHRPKTLSTKAGDLAARHPEAAQRVVLPVDPRAASPYRPGVVRGGDGGLRVRGVDPCGRRSGRGDGHRHRHLQVRGVPDLCRPRRTRRRVPQPHPRPHRVPVRVSRRHLRQRPRRRPLVEAATGLSPEQACFDHS